MIAPTLSVISVDYGQQFVLCADAKPRPTWLGRPCKVPKDPGGRFFIQLREFVRCRLQHYDQVLREVAVEVSNNESRLVGGVNNHSSIKNALHRLLNLIHLR